MPKELVEELNAHKPEVMDLLKLRGYRLRYPGNQVNTEELTEIAASVERDGYVLLWSNVLQDLVAFYKAEAEQDKILSGFVPYSVAELDRLFGQEKPLVSLKLIHEAKKLGGRVVDNESR